MGREPGPGAYLLKQVMSSAAACSKPELRAANPATPDLNALLAWCDWVSPWSRGSQRACQGSRVAAGSSAAPLSLPRFLKLADAVYKPALGCPAGLVAEAVKPYQLGTAQMTASQQHGGAPSRQVGFRPVAGPHTGSSHLSDFDPPQDAEPTTAPSAEESSQSTPTVLSKLQKWGDYASVGEPVKPTKFIPMKTPMSREIISNWTLGTGPKHSLTVPELLEWQAARDRQVGMIIDLVRRLSRVTLFLLLPLFPPLSK